MELQLIDITKNYKDQNVLKGISLTMGTGVYGILGPNGAGKTTMIRILADVLRPTKGSVLYDGKDIHALGDEYRAKIGYLPQDVSFYSDFTGRDYLEYSAALKGMEKAHAKKKIEELAQSVGLSDDLDRKYFWFSAPWEFSGLGRCHPVRSHLCPVHVSVESLAAMGDTVTQRLGVLVDFGLVQREFFKNFFMFSSPRSTTRRW